MTTSTSIQSCKVDIPEIDDQHGHLISLIEKLETGVEVGLEKALLVDAIKKLARYVTVHFAYEENLLRDSGYPEFAQHQCEHEAFAAHVRYLTRRVELGYAPRCAAVLGFLKQWLIRHIQGSDHKYAEFLKTRGVV